MLTYLTACVSQSDVKLNQVKQNNQSKTLTENLQELDQVHQSFVRKLTTDEMKYIHYLLQSAECGDFEAQLKIGYYYYTGEFFQQDLDKAKYWFQLSADQGAARAQLLLALVQMDLGEAIQNPEVSLKYIKASAAKGNYEAVAVLGDFYFDGLYFDGLMVDHDPLQAIIWYEKAAALGNEKGQYNTALSYKQGRGIKQDKVKAFHWYHKAAEKDHASAQFQLGNLYAFGGKGIEKNSQKAIQWWRKAVKNGYSKANFRLMNH